MKTTLITLAMMLSAGHAAAQEVAFDDHFEDRTLRIDYIFAGDSAHQAIYFQEASCMNTWAGRRHHLSRPLLTGNAQVEVIDPTTNEVLYANSFSTLFQEWQSQEEATKVHKAFENVLMVPFPKHPVDIRVSLTDVHQKVSASLTHGIDPKDILIRPLGHPSVTSRYMLKSGTPDHCIDIAIIADGYTEQEQDKFFRDAQRAADVLMGHEPFKSKKDQFNIVAVATPSAESGVSVPHSQAWKNTALRTHYDTFYSDRYLTTSDMRHIYDQLSDVPFEHIIVLINTPIYGGGGIYNSVMFSSSDHPTFRQVFVHEFGHSFAGLGDEYFYDDQYSSMYPADTEPWEPNLTTLVDFDSKWKDMLSKKTPVPTPPADIPNYRTASTPKELKALNDATQRVGVFEGGGYQSKGVYRPAQECRMKVNEVEHFCPVCTRAIIRMIDYYTE